MPPSNAGITTDAVTGERFIPSSVRPDGSKRREIRVRPGYKPPEDVELYRNRAAAAWKNRGKTPGGGVPGAEGLKPTTATTTTAAADNSTDGAASNKNAKRREAKKKAKATTGGPDGETEGKSVRDLENWRTPPSAKDAGSKAVEDKVEEDPEAEKEKKARNLKKKIRQARELRDKKNQGEALLPEQLEKVIKIQELIRQLDGLGLDAHGDKKGEEGAAPSDV
ncbi:putative RNA binding protein Pym [Aspergillus candidus]|uniref:WIBG Mago-binding domain-containing protein n=1 Tax=Aspergillus candidus TaxID=41067 RepID=A0A2I2FG06_ASPCN|nr:hypothetical protein BDW47DRAFT_102720 [Aspergillus candidus]PLB39563.1 hypothetical protein BDW47DRAFT_102720 [Aspergillus candidus]